MLFRSRSSSRAPRRDPHCGTRRLLVHRVFRNASTSISQSPRFAALLLGNQNRLAYPYPYQFNRQTNFRTRRHASIGFGYSKFHQATEAAAFAIGMAFEMEPSSGRSLIFMGITAFPSNTSHIPIRVPRIPRKLVCSTARPPRAPIDGDGLLK